MQARTVQGRAYGGEAQPALILRSEGKFDRRAYDRSYYHTVRKAKITQDMKDRINARRRARYLANIEDERAKQRERYRDRTA